MATLVVADGPASGQQFALGSHPLVLLGRDDQCTFQIVDKHVSRRHCQIRFDPNENRHYAIDYRSSKGVVVNGNKITGEHPLADGDVIQIGGTTIVYSAEDSPDAQRVMDQLRKLGEGGEPTIIPDPR